MLEGPFKSRCLACMSMLLIWIGSKILLPFGLHCVIVFCSFGIKLTKDVQ